MSQWEPASNEVPSQPPPALPGADDVASRRPGGGRGRDVRLVVTGVAVALLAWFAFVNLQTVRIRFWLTSAHAPLILVIVISGVLGALAPGVWSRVIRRRRPGGRS
jgi:uncharacterized integral membrane protein